MAQWTQKWWPRSPQNFVRTVYPTSRGPKSFVRTENLRCRRQRSFLSGLSSKVAAIFENFVRTPESYLLAAFSGVLMRQLEFENEPTVSPTAPSDRRLMIPSTINGGATATQSHCGDGAAPPPPQNKII